MEKNKEFDLGGKGQESVGLRPFSRPFRFNFVFHGFSKNYVRRRHKLEEIAKKFAVKRPCAMLYSAHIFEVP